MSEDRSLLERIQHLVERETFSLPVLNETSFQLQALVGKQSSNMRDVAAIIKRDQTLATEVLRAANSAFFGGLAEITTIQNAVMRLGAQQVINIVYLMSERSKYRARDPLLASVAASMWKHASASAMAAEWLGSRVQYRDREEAFLAGLLHNIGELVLVRALDEFKASEEKNFSFSPELVEEVLASAHTKLGFDFLTQRRIPEVYCRIARDHHLEKPEVGDFLMALVRLTDLGLRKLGLGFQTDSTLVLAATQEATSLRVGEILMAEFEVMLEDYVASEV